jgi:hypothetical protein
MYVKQDRLQEAALKYAQRFPDRVLHFAPDETGVSGTITVCARTPFNGIEVLETVELPLRLPDGSRLTSRTDWLEHQVRMAGPRRSKELPN